MVGSCFCKRQEVVEIEDSEQVVEAAEGNRKSSPQAVGGIEIGETTVGRRRSRSRLKVISADGRSSSPSAVGRRENHGREVGVGIYVDVSSGNRGKFGRH